MKAIKRKTVIDKLKDRILQEIATGNLRPGDLILSLNQLSRTYGVSKSSAEKTIRELSEQGVIKSIPGKGNFVSGDINIKNTLGQNNDCKLIGISFPVTGIESMNLTRNIKEYVLNKNGVLSFYDVVADRQDPSLEYKFLKRLEDSGACGIGVFATPLEPLNSDFYKSLRAKGVKVALLAPCSYDLCDEVCFLPDFRLCGYRMAKHVYGKGYRTLCFVHTRQHRPVFSRWLKEGIMTASEDAGIDFFGDLLVESYNSEEKHNRNMIKERNLHLMDRLKSLPADTAFIGSCYIDCLTIYDLLRELNSPLAEEERFVFCDRPKDEMKEKITCFAFDYEKILMETVDYLMSSDVSSTEIFHKLYAPIIVEG